MESACVSFCTFNEYMRILDLAFDYLSIDPKEIEKISEIIKKKIAENSVVSLEEILVQENLIPEDQADQVKAFDEHLRTLEKDQKFGELAIANQMVTEQAVAAARQQQQESFGKYRINLKLDDILVEEKALSSSNRMAILLTQNRIEDEKLFEALSEIGVDPFEKEAINKRFGVLAIKKELVTIDQVNAALEIQEKEHVEKGTSRFIGQILQEIAELSPDDVQMVLNEQRQFEKRRMDLEKALYNTKMEIKIAKRLSRIFEYDIMENGVEVKARRKKQTEEPVSVYEFLIWLRRAGIQFGIVKDSEIEAFIQDTGKKPEIVVARGIPMLPSVDERVEFYFEMPEAQEADKAQKPKQEEQEEQEDETPDEVENSEEEASESQKDDEDTEQAQEDNPEEQESVENQETEEEQKETVSETDENKTGEKEKTAPPEDDTERNIDAVLVQKGALLAKIFPGAPGRPGKDALGHPILPKKPAIQVLNAGKGVVKKGAEFYAIVSGRPVLKTATTLVVETIEEQSNVKTLTSPVTYDTEQLYTNSRVELNREIYPEGILRCYSLEISGHIKGSVVCAGEVVAKSNIGVDEKAEEGKEPQIASIVSKGSIRTSKTIANADIRTEGQVMGYNSVVYGSRIIAMQGITVKDALAGNLGPTTLRFGLAPKDKLHAIEHTIENKKEQLAIFKKEDQIAQLQAEYEKELKTEKQHELEQNVYLNLIEIIEAPELYQHETLVDKIEYLKDLPDFSSVKAAYYKLPEHGDDLQYLEKLLASVEKLSLQDKLTEFKKKLDEPEEVDEDSHVDTGEYHAQTQFKAKMAALEKEIEAQAPEIEKIENSINELEKLKERLVSMHVKDISKSKAGARVKNKCEKGTIIKGKVASLILDRSLYNVSFTEVLDVKNHTAFISIDKF